MKIAHATLSPICGMPYTNHTTQQKIDWLTPDFSMNSSKQIALNGSSFPIKNSEMQ